MSCLYSLEKTVHSLITQYPLGKVYPQFHITAFSLISLVGAYLYYREYKNPPTNPNKIFLPDPRKTAIKFGDKTVSLVENKQEVASFLPKAMPEKVKISPDIVTQVKDNALLKAVIFQSVKFAFVHKFVGAKEALETFKRAYECAPEEMQEISRRVGKVQQFIDQLELISKWGYFGSFNESSTIEDLLILARWTWENAMLLTEKNKEFASFFSLIEIGLSKGWLEPTDRERYETVFAKMIDEVNQQLEKTWICHLMNRAYRALESSQKIDIDPNYIEIPPNAKDDKALIYLCQLAKYFHRLGNHEQSVSATFENIFLILKTKPIDIDECSNIFTLVLSCFTFQQKDGMFWAIGEMKKSILENREEAPKKKIQLLLVIQNDYKSLNNLVASDETLDRIIELINTLPQEEKKPWVEKAALALYQLQLYEKANQLITKHNESIEEVTDRIPLMQSIFLGVLALSTCFVRPFYPLCASVLVPLIPTVMRHRT